MSGTGTVLGLGVVTVQVFGGKVAGRSIVLYLYWYRLFCMYSSTFLLFQILYSTSTVRVLVFS